jgi:cytochrome c biogenesis protein
VIAQADALTVRPIRLLGGKARRPWRALTSMGTALVLLFLLALGAVPGALLPQRSLNETKVAQYQADHPVISPWLDRLQLFDVFSSFWFTAIYVLLFISLVGCLTPRILEHIRSMRATPVPAPRNLSRLPRHAAGVVTGTPEGVAARIDDGLRGWRRTTRTVDGFTEISAEKGYLREFGNIVFHFSLLGLLAAVAVGKLFGYEGNVIVIADGGPGFCSASPAAFDSFRAGNKVDGTSLYPMCVRVNDFKARRADIQKELAQSGIKALPTPFSGSGKIYTQKDFVYLYLLDSGNNHILILDKKASN